MSNVVVVGMQWGDEGKGKIVDLICPAFSGVVRFQGGHNAGHTVKFGDRHFALHLVPSGVLHEGMHCYLGNGMVIAPDALLEELAALERAGVDWQDRVFISDRAQVLLPAHALLDQAREGALGDDKIGTTSRGIGPAYEAKAARLGVRMGDLFCGGWKKQWPLQRARIAHELGLHGAAPELEQLDAAVERWREGLAPLVRDINLDLAQAVGRGDSLLFEGAQGTLLDVDFGTYPFVTSSNGTAGGACIGSGVPPTAIDGVVGILKAYTTRVGAGPFPVELLSTEPSSPGERLRQRGNEFGTTTGRPRRCGWLDLVVARYAQRINGVGSVALTKLDVLDQFEEIEVCHAYRIDGELVNDLPASIAALERAEPVYRTVPGWNQSTVGALSFEQLPSRAQAYVEMIEEEVGAPVELISTGPRREETIARGRVLESWLGRPIEATA